ncbi:MAG: hypothetical protein GF401_19530 [Chitinivibrionales bacterium]|nr:hypothetical protein [Chitinivibrionales bacterium]
MVDSYFRFLIENTCIYISGGSGGIHFLIFPGVKQSCTIVSYENLCENPAAVLTERVKHTALPVKKDFLESFAATNSPSLYYKPQFTDEQAAAVKSITTSTANLFGYNHF